jgi:glycosyltransferase involved in cell wall biosynthesis
MISGSTPGASDRHPVLFLCPAPAIGGAERVVLEILSHLDKERWAPHLAIARGESVMRSAVDGFPVHEAPMPRLRNPMTGFPRLLWYGHNLSRLARQLNARAIYANTIRAAFYGSTAAAMARIPFVWHVQDLWLSESEPYWQRLDSMLKRWICDHTYAVVAASRAIAANLPPTRHCSVIPNGIDLRHFDPKHDGSEFRLRHGIPSDAPLVGMLGRLRPWKGQERFLEMATQVLRKEPDTYFLVGGGTPFQVRDGYAAHLQHLATASGLLNRVRFTGELEDVRPALSAMDVFVHPGDPEPFGLVNIEAMAMGKPVVALSHGALPEIVADGITGILVSPDRVQELSGAVLSLLRDSGARRRLGVAARRRVAAHFTGLGMTTGIAAILESAASGSE